MIESHHRKCHTQATRGLRTAAWACVACTLTFGAIAQRGWAALPQESDSTAAAHLLSAQQGREIAATALAAGQTPPPPSPKKSPEANYSYHMNEGVFAGRSPHDLIDEAIQWWRKELDTIEESAAVAER